MVHKVHPKAFRLREVNDWDSRWLSKKNLPEQLEEDFKIREFLKRKLKDTGLQKVEIERFSGKINIIINSARPGLVIGRGGKGLEDLKKEMEKIVDSLLRSELKIEIREIRDVWTKASLAGQWIAQQIERRVPHRRVIKQALDKIMISKEVKGARVEVAGRLNGAEIARREWLKKGRLPRQTLRADIDYDQTQAFCNYGVVGVKVWIYKGEKF